MTANIALYLISSTADNKRSIMYSSGMRVSEVIHLHYDDISRSNMQIHVRDTKNRMDRYTILSKRCLDILTQYWFEKGRPRGILFPNKFTGNYLTVSTLEQVMRRAVADAELPKTATPHCLRGWRILFKVCCIKMSKNILDSGFIHGQHHLSCQKGFECP